MPLVAFNFKTYKKPDKIRGLKNTACLVVFIFYPYVDYAYGLRNIIHILWITCG